ncbi:protease-4 [Breoghania corrubedonensis]|uniref:Protease-4 n=1 Tax=Breoghania corrubedonensis TaxID=665038 RepID=A0A2T5VG54_9HYPH|nr:signal peptide peptidase SppA [Breoghania corrubedonensis]PTW62744.1 protease-4 [Breoghania corrubedonensis]
MTSDADMIVDRRRLRRKLTFWRVFAILGITAAIIVAGAYAFGVEGGAKSRPHIARLDISGLITDDRDRLKLIDRMTKSDAVKGVIVTVNSPGGSTTGGEGVVEALAKLRAKKPVVAHIGTVGASAGYMIAIAADHVIARRNSITASIGVLFQFGNAAKLLDTIGVKMEAVKSAPLKAEPDFYSETTPQARAMLASLVKDSYDWFVDFVAERRGLDQETARGLADGRVMTGNQALEAKLIDEVGGEDDARQWLVSKKGLDAGLPVIDWRKDDTGLGGLGFTGKVAQLFGKGVAEAVFGSTSIRKIVLPEALMLDGLVSVWQAPSIAETEMTGGANE